MELKFQVQCIGSQQLLISQLNVPNWPGSLMKCDVLRELLYSVLANILAGVLSSLVMRTNLIGYSGEIGGVCV